MHEAEWENGGGVGSNVESVGGVHPGRELRLAHGIWQFYLRPTLFVYVYIYIYVCSNICLCLYYIAIYMCIYIYICTRPCHPPPWDGSHIRPLYEIFSLPPLWCGGGVVLSLSPLVVWWGCGTVPLPPCGVVGVWYCPPPPLWCGGGVVWYVGYVWCVWSVWYGMSGKDGVFGMYGRYAMYGMNGCYCMDGKYGM